MSSNGVVDYVTFNPRNNKYYDLNGHQERFGANEYDSPPHGTSGGCSNLVRNLPREMRTNDMSRMNKVLLGLLANVLLPSIGTGVIVSIWYAIHPVQKIVILIPDGLVSVIRCKRYIPAGTLISYDDLEEIRLRPDELPQGAIDLPAIAAARRLTTDLPKGHCLTLNDLALLDK